MSTEIGQLKSVQTTAAQDRERVSRTGAGTGGTSGGRAAAQAGTDEVSLSSSALTLKAVERRLAEQPEVDQARVDAIRDALGKGTYRIDPGRIADGILSQERMFHAGDGR